MVASARRGKPLLCLWDIPRMLLRKRATQEMNTQEMNTQEFNTEKLKYDYSGVYISDQNLRKL